MDAEMVAMFPKGIRALIIDDDTKFVKSATMLLSILNFEVVPCSSITYALKSLTNGDFKGIDVILAHAAKAAACGFDFRAIVETDLLIPVIYFLPQDHQATGDEADELLSMLQEGTYIMKKPLDIHEVRTRLWNVIAWHKCHLETKASGGSTSGKRTADEAGLDAEGEDEDRVHYKVVRARCGRKRKGSSSSAAAGCHPMAKGKEKVNEASQLQPAQQKQGQGKNAQKNDGGEPFKLQQPNAAIPQTPNVPPPTYNPKFFTSSSVPTYDPNYLFFSYVAGPSSNADSTSNVSPPAMHPIYSSTPSALPPAAPQQQQTSVHNAVFGNIVSPAAYEPPQFSPNIGNQQQQDIPSLMTFGPFPYQGPALLPPPVVPQDMVTTPAAVGDRRFTSDMAGGGGASAAAAIEAGAYNNEVNLSFLEASILGAEQPVAPQNISDASNEAAMLEALFSDDYSDCSSESSFTTALSQVLGMASNVNEPTTMNAFGNINAAPFVAPQVLNIEPNGGSSSSNTASFTTSNVSDLTLTDGAFDNSSFALFMVPQDLGAASNGARNNVTLSMAHQALIAAQGGGSNNDIPFMAPHQDLDAASNGGGSNATPSPFMVPRQDLSVESNGDQLVLENNIMGQQGHGSAATMQGDGAGITAPVLPSDQYEDNTSFPLEALLGDLLHGPIFEFDDIDLDALVSGSISGGATAEDAAGTSFISGGGMDDSAIISLDGLEIPEGLFAEYGNNICG